MFYFIIYKLFLLIFFILYSYTHTICVYIRICSYITICYY